MHRSPLRAAGFSLIEALLMLAFAAVLAGIAWPSWSEHLARSERSSVQAAMLELSLRQHRRSLHGRDYAHSVEALGAALPAAVSRRWDIRVEVDEPEQGFRLVAAVTDAAPAGPCAVLTLDERGARLPASCW
jgi:type IV pilus assembly protein PilE